MNVCYFHIEKEAFPACTFINLLTLCLLDLMRKIIYSLEELMLIKRESERIENGRERMRMLNEGNPIRTMYPYAPLCQPHLTDDPVKGSHSQYLCACALGFVHLSVEDHACKGLYVYVNNIQRWRTDLSGQGSPERFP